MELLFASLEASLISPPVATLTFPPHAWSTLGQLFFPNFLQEAFPCTRSTQLSQPGVQHPLHSIPAVPVHTPHVNSFHSGLLFVPQRFSWNFGLITFVLSSGKLPSLCSLSLTLPSVSSVSLYLLVITPG